MKKSNFVLFLSVFGIFSYFILILLSQKILFAFNVPIEIFVTGCGDGVREEGEECDGNDLGGKTCQTLGYRGGILKCKINCTFDTSECLAFPLGGGGVPFLTETKIIFEGKAFPKGKVHLLIDGKEVSLIEVDEKGNFRKEIREINPGVFTFSFWGEDSRRRRTATISLTRRILSGISNYISPVFLPPTIEANKISVERGEKIEFSGQTTPYSTVFLYLDSPENLIANLNTDSQGEWKYFFETGNLKEGVYKIKAKTKSPEGLESPFSSILTFSIGKYGIEEICPRGDFNKDGRTNLVDFSILLHWWGKSNSCVDLNKDGIVNLPDFSILLHWWTG